MKISLVISIKNRTKLFSRSIKMYNKQTIPKEDWEMVVVDDMSDEDVLGTLKKYAKFNWQYIKMDSKKNDFPIYWGPSLSNNIGFKSAKGEVLVITGPEMLMQENALEISYETAMKGVAAYGHVLHSHNKFVKLMDSNPAMEEYPFKRLFALPTAKNGYPDITKDNFYWFWTAVKRETIIKMGGCDENFMKGICGDDDIFAEKVKMIGCEPVHEMRIKGIHQEHLTADKADPKRIRWNPTWEKARHINTKYLEDWRADPNRSAISNEGRDWGSEKLVIERVESKETN